jgi:membrane-associated phospholipid phosphatase
VPTPLPAGSPELQLEIAEMRALRATLSEPQQEAMRAWDSGAVLRWNKTARDLVARYRLDPLTATRVYTLLSLAQHQALQVAAENQRFYGRQMPPVAGAEPLLTSSAPAAYPSEHAALAAASATVLNEFFPGETQQIEASRTEQQESRLWAGLNCRSDLLAGDALGREIATTVLNQSRDEVNQLTQVQEWPAGPDKWRIDQDDPMPPLLPAWSTLTPMLMERADQFRAPPPPAFGSPAFQAALAEVRRISDTRTPEQEALAKKWAYGLGTPTPPGAWNEIAADLIAKRQLRDSEAARLLAYLNMALYDTGISTWDTKYHYWLIRPFHADTAITTVVRRPPHPSYSSGHSAFSGAAAAFLSKVFPDQAKSVEKLAKEASESRIVGGIHYRFDCEAGLDSGRAIGLLAFERMSRPE